MGEASWNGASPRPSSCSRSTSARGPSSGRCFDYESVHRMSGTIVRGATIVTPSGRKRADIYSDGGVIRSVGSDLDVPSGAYIVDAGGLVVLPGVIDPHSHLWEAG